MYTSLEEMTNDIEKGEKKWHEIYDKKAKEVERKIDCLLADLSEQNIIALIQLFECEHVKTELRKTVKIGYMICVMSIFAQEMNAGERDCILSLGGSISDFMNLMKQVKFLLWRIEFENDEDAIEELCAFAASSPASPQFFAEMIKYVNIKKNHMFTRLGKAMGDYGLEHYREYLIRQIC